MSLSLEHLPLLGYFALIGALLVTVAPQFLRKPNAMSLVFLILALASLGSTWTYMFAFFRRSFEDSAFRAGLPAASYSTRAWLADVSLFQEAWQYVCATPHRYWWSEQLCLWTTGPLTILLAVDGRRYGIKRTWAYMLLGQVVAISFAQNLFFAAIALSPRPAAAQRKPATPTTPGALPPKSAEQSPLTWLTLLAVVLANASVAFAPHTNHTRFFLPNLLLMHAVLFLPFVFPDRKSAPVNLSRFYLNIGLVALRFRAPTIFEIVKDKGISLSVKEVLPRVPELLYGQWKVLNEHPAQQSIGWDVIFTSLSALAYLAWTVRRPVRKDDRVDWIYVLLAAVGIPFVGAGTAVGCTLAIFEGKREQKEDAVRKLEETRRAEAVKGVAALGGDKKKKQ